MHIALLLFDFFQIQIVGGYAYSVKVNPWPWLTSRSAAEDMAEKVAEWPEKYGCDGIDLDIEDGAGDAKGAGKNMLYFIKRLKRLRPKMIIGQPTYGYPAVHFSDLLVFL